MGRYARNSIGQYAPVGAAADDLPGGATPTGKKTIDTTAEVDVASYATAQVVDENLTAENIKKDVPVLGITGEYEGSGGSTLADAIYPFGAKITFNVSGVPQGSTAQFASFIVGDEPLFANTEFGYQPCGENLVFGNGNGQEFCILGSEEASAYIIFDDGPNWTITCDSNSRFNSEVDNYYIEITGDTTIGLVFIG